MKRSVSLTSFLSGNTPTATIIIDKLGMRVVNKQPSYERDDSFIRSFILRCIDMDHWKHSWHIDVSKARFKRSKERRKIRQILNEKISQRYDEIQMLKDARNVLGRW